MHEIEDLLRMLAKTFPSERERNIFSIGAKRYYENPTSDILGFFLNPMEIHQLGDLVLRSLLEAAHIATFDTNTVQSVYREAVTDDDKRIDITVQGKFDILIVENKIRHSASNPFSSYEEHSKKYGVGLRQHFIILSPRREAVSTPWISVQYMSFISIVHRNLATRLLSTSLSKWVVLLREFALNIEEECAKSFMEEEKFAFVATHYRLMRQVQVLTNLYIEEIRRRLRDTVMSVSLTGTNVRDTVEEWAEADAKTVRLYSSAWSTQTNVSVLVLSSGGFRIQFYVYNIEDQHLEYLYLFMSNHGILYPCKWTEAKTIRCFGYYDCDNFDSAVSEVEKISLNLNAYHQA